MTTSATPSASTSAHPPASGRAAADGFALGLPPAPRTVVAACVAGADRADSRDRDRRAPGGTGGARIERVPSVGLRADARRQVHVLRDRRAGARSRVGLLRHPEPWPCAVLRARRLRDGHVPDALHRPRRQIRQRPAGLHGVPRLAQAALVLAGHRPSRLCVAAGRSRAGRGRVGVRVFHVPFAREGRVSVDHHAGDDVCRNAAVLPQRDRVRRQQRLSPISSGSPGSR